MRPDALDEIISQLTPEEVPTEFIVIAKVTTMTGEENFLTGEELEIIMENPEQYGIAETRIILDVHRIRKAIIDEVDELFRRARDSDE